MNTNTLAHTGPGHFGAKQIMVALVLLVLAVSPWFASEFLQHLAILTCLNIVAVNGLALIARSGQLSLGHAAFMAIGAYSSVLAANYFGLPFIPALLLGIVVTALIAFALGWAILRLRGVYFVLVTFAFGELIRLVLLDFAPITGGANGIAGIPAIEVLGFSISSRPGFYGVAVLAAALSTWGLYRLFTRPLGQAIDSVAVNPSLAEATGLSVHRLQIFAFVSGCSIAAIAGILQSKYIGYISPESFNSSISIGLIIMLVIGGRGSSWGPLVGAIVLTPLPELFRGAVQTQHIFYGAALILILRFMPGGLADLPTRLHALISRSKKMNQNQEILLSISDVSRRFGGLMALRDLSFNVRKGEIVGLIGPNGAGKTTAFNVITGTLPPSSGEVRFNGQKISGQPPARVVVAGLARTFQATSTYPQETVTDNIYRGMLPRIRESLVGAVTGRYHRDLPSADVANEIKQILQITDLERWADVEAGSLPYGLQKKLGIAVALATRPTMLLLDEPAAGLNHEECNELTRLLRRLRDEHGLTLLLVEHHMALVMELCQRIVVLVHGEKIAEGTPEEVRQHPAVIEAYLGAPDYAHA